MDFRELAVPGSLLIEPQPLADNRGSFFEALKQSAFIEAAGRPFPVAQVNYSVSRRGVVRGVHGVAIPPGQAKIVSCVRGALLDVVVDLRVGSPTFGRYDTNLLDALSGRSLYVAEGLGHGFLALADDTCISYFCSTEYVPGTQVDLNPFDPELALPWRMPDGSPTTASEKDLRAPTLREAAAAGSLPTYEECLTYYARAAAPAAV